MKDLKSPQIIKGGIFADERGELAFVNDFNPGNARRFYTIKHHNINVIRAWQGHEVEHKYFFPLSGKFLIAFVQIDNFNAPSEQLSAQFAILDAGEPGILAIPAGFANGLKAMTLNAMIGVFSEFEIERSVNGKRRYDPNLWFNWHKNYAEKYQINRIYKNR